MQSPLSHNPPLRQHSEPVQHDLLEGGLKRTHHSIDEALSSAQCVGTAVLSAKDGVVTQVDSVAEDEMSNGTACSNVVRTECEISAVDVSSSVPYYGTSPNPNQERVCDIRQKQTPDLVLDLPLRLSSGPHPIQDCDADVQLGASDDIDETSHSSSSPTGPESPDMTTAAERFAKQNQCTLKKNTKATQSLGSPLDDKASSAHRSPRHSKSVDSQSEKDALKSADGAVSLVTSEFATPSNINEKKPTVSSFKPPIKAKPQMLKNKPVPSAAAPMPVSKEGQNLAAPDCGNTN